MVNGDFFSCSIFCSGSSIALSTCLEFPVSSFRPRVLCLDSVSSVSVQLFCYYCSSILYCLGIVRSPFSSCMQLQCSKAVLNGLFCNKLQDLYFEICVYLVLCVQSLQMFQCNALDCFTSNWRNSTFSELCFLKCCLSQ